jgi:hypothetical protein
MALSDSKAAWRSEGICDSRMVPWLDDAPFPPVTPTVGWRRKLRRPPRRTVGALYSMSGAVLRSRTAVDFTPLVQEVAAQSL